MESIDINKEIVNNSPDVYKVKKSLDELLNSIDFIMTYNEEQLNSVGMSKTQLPTQREFIVENYDIVLKQTEERYKGVLEAGK